MLMGGIKLRRGTSAELPGRVGRRKMGNDKVQETRPDPGGACSEARADPLHLISELIHPRPSFFLNKHIRSDKVSYAT
jgi:hypothetical protein